MGSQQELLYDGNITDSKQVWHYDGNSWKSTSFTLWRYIFDNKQVLLYNRNIVDGRQVLHDDGIIFDS